MLHSSLLLRDSWIWQRDQTAQTRGMQQEILPIHHSDTASAL